MPETITTFDKFDQAIIRALRKHLRGVRYTQLNEESRVDGEKLNVKTFNAHLKRLVEEGLIERFNKSRARFRVRFRCSLSPL